MKRLVTQQIA